MKQTLKNRHLARRSKNSSRVNQQRFFSGRPLVFRLAGILALFALLALLQPTQTRAQNAPPPDRNAGQNSAPLSAPTISATKTVDKSTANPGDTLNYTVIVTDTVTDATNVQFTDMLTSSLTLVGGSVIASPVAVDDTYPQTLVGNVSINSSLIPFSVLTNDYLGLNPTATITAFDSTSAQGGNVTMNTSTGTFTYNPPPGYTGADTFHYTLSNSTGSSIGTVNFTISGMVWFINNNAASCTTLAAGCGRLSNPFSTLAAFNALNNGSGNNPAANDNIFVYESATQYTGSVTLLNGQKLIGQDATASLSTITGLTPPSSSPSFPAMNSANGTITNIDSTVTLNTNATVRGLGINSTTSTGMNDPVSAITGVSVSEVKVTTTTGTAVSLSDVDGTLSFISISANGGANGIVLVNFAQTSGSFTVNGDGSNTTQGGNSSGGTISNAAGTNGATAGAGIYLSSAKNVTLRRMTINGTNQNFGIRGLSVTNFTMEYSTVSGTNGDSTPDREGAVIFDNMFGTNAITSSIISGAIEDNVRVENTTGILTAFNLTNSRIQNNSTVSGNDGFRFATATTGVTMTGTVSGTTFQGNRTIAIQADASNGTVNFTASNNTIIAGTGGNNQGNQGIEVDVANNGVMNFSVTGNKVGTDGVTNQPLLNTGINIFNATLVTSGTPAATTGAVTNNTVYNAGSGTSGFGIRLFNQGYGTMNANVSGNTVNNVGLDYGIFAEVSSNSGTANATGSSSIAMTGNTSNVLSGGLDAIRVQARGRSTMCARISGNASTTAGSGFFGLEIRQAAQTISSVTYQATFNLEGLTNGLQTDHTTIVNYLASQNPSVTDGVDEIHSTGITGVAANSCSSIPSGWLLPNNSQGVAQAVIEPDHTDNARTSNVLANSENAFNISLNFANLFKQTAAVTRGAKPDQAINLAEYFSSPFGSIAEASALNNSAIQTELGQGTTPLGIPMLSGETVSVGPIGTLPAGKSVTIKFQATIANPFTTGPSVSNQGTVSGTGFSNVQTNTAVTNINLPDLRAAKTNNVSGSITLGSNWTWTIPVTNTGAFTASFSSGQTILSDNLPDTNIGYNLTTTNISLSSPNSGAVNCSINITKDLSCTANGAVTLGIGGVFSVQLTAAPTGAGTFANPRAGGSCSVDPNNVVNEGNNENNNTCNNSVTVTAPDLTISKSNNVSGTLTFGNAFTWTLHLANTGNAAATFTSGQTILTDTLPNNNITYGGVVVSNILNVTGGANISCAIIGGNLSCTANGGSVTLNAGTGVFDVQFSATPNAATTFTNPRLGGLCQIDPNNNIVESNESNDNCNSNSVSINPFHLHLPIILK